MTKVWDYILKHQQASNDRLYLVPSENAPSINARLAFLTDVLNRYYFPLEKSSGWAFPGNEWLEAIHQYCEELLRKVTGARYVNIRPISGINAMTVVLAALLRGGETVATISPENGGHTTTTVIARRLGARVVYLPYNQKGFTVDVDSLQEFILRERVSLVYLDKTHILFPYPLKEMRLAIPPHIPIYYDGSHVLGLIFGGIFQEPLKEGATFLGGSTHKTIPGPHKGFIATNDMVQAEKIIPYARKFVSHDHGGDIAALAIILEEMEDRWPSYAAQIVRNSQKLGRLLSEKGFLVAAPELGFTKTHQLWLDIAPYIDAFEATKILARCNIIVNATNAPSVSGRLSLRIGVQEITYLGATEKIIEEIADIFGRIFINKCCSEEEIKQRVADIKKRLLPPFDLNNLERVIDLLRGHS